MANLSQWRTNTGQLLLRRLPNNDLASALALVDAWLAANGGWVPDLAYEPEGEGSTAGDVSSEAVVDAVVVAERAKTRVLTLTLPMVVTVSVAGSFASGTLQADMVSALQSLAQSRVDALFEDDGVKVASYTWGSVTSSLRTAGTLTYPQMQSVQAEIVAGGRLVDPAAVATVHARGRYGLDTTWVCQVLYSRADNTKPLACEVRKFVNSTYATPDAGATYYFVVNVDRVSGQAQSVVKLPV